MSLFSLAIQALLLLALGPGIEPAAGLNESAEPGFMPQTVLLTDLRVVTAPGQTLDNGRVLIRQGRIVSVGAELVAPPDAETLALPGHVVYAGFVDAGNTALLDPEARLPAVESRSVDTSRSILAGLRPDDHSGLTPQFQAQQGLRLNEADRHRQAGLCAVHVTPHGRIVNGQAAVLQLSGLPSREAVLMQGEVVTIQLLERRGGDYPATLMGTFAHLRQKFLDADLLSLQRRLWETNPTGITRPPVDAVLTEFEALAHGRRRPWFSVATRDDVERVLRFSDEHKLTPTLWGGHELAKSLDELTRRRLDVIATVDFGDEPKLDAPASGDEYSELAAPKAVREHRHQQWKDRAATLAELQKAGIRFAVSSQGLKAPEELLKGLRQAITAGLPRDAALAALTTNPAAMLGVERELGQIEPGRLANLVVLTGPFDEEASKVRYVFVEGRRFEYHKDAKPATETKPAPTTADLAGTWQLEIDGADGKTSATIELHQVEKRLTGRFQSGQGDGLISAGIVAGEHVEWQVSIGAGDRAVVLKFAGDHKEGRLTGTVKSPFGAATSWTGQRQAAATTNPVQLTSVEPEPVSALQPMQPATAGDLPTEFPSHRTARAMTTGGRLFLKGGTVLTGTGMTLPSTSILVEDGRIKAIGPDLQPPEGITVLDLAGKFVMPGIIDTHSHIMISNGLGGVNEATHSVVCEVRVSDAINTADASEYRALAGGVTTIRMLHGSANVIGGQDAVVQLKHGASAAEHLLPGAHGGVKFALGENVKFRQGRFPNTRLGVEATLQRAFVEALDYRRQWQQHEQALKTAGDPAAILPPRKDLRLGALADILNHQKFIHSHCYRSDEILMLLRVATQYGIRVWSLQHVLEGYKVAPEIVQHGASCSTFADWWAYKVEAFDAAPHNAALLHEAGANVVIKSDDAELIRHLYLEAQKPIRYGNLPPEAALPMVTLNAARELGLSDRLGSIEVGKQADFAIFNAHPLNTFARCELTLIAGEPYFIREKQPTAMSAAGLAQSASPVPVVIPAADQRRPLVDWSSAGNRFALTNAVIHPVDGPVIPQGAVVIEQGKIAAVGANVAVPEGCPTINLDGLHVYPGLIDAGTTVGINEIGKVVETHDFAETGQFQPDLRAGVALNPDSELIPVARAGGITTALLKPQGGIVCGQASVANFAGWTAPEMMLVLEAGLQINWPGYRSSRDQFDQLRDWWKAAKQYDRARSAAADAGGIAELTDPRYEALRPYVRAERPIFVQADSRQQISEALEWSEKEKVKLIITGGTDAWKLADQLKARDVPVIVGPVMRKPVEDYDPFDAPYANPGRLQEAGVRFCIRSDNAANSRNAPFEAAMAVAYGLPEEASLRSVTLSAAEILGIADRCGSITAGKRADLVILDGSPLQITSQVKGVVIGGQTFSPASRQTQLAEKYRERLRAWRQSQQPVTH